MTARRRDELRRASRNPFHVSSSGYWHAGGAPISPVELLRLLNSDERLEQVTYKPPLEGWHPVDAEAR